MHAVPLLDCGGGSLAALPHFSADDAELASVFRNRAHRIASEVEATERRLALLPVARKLALEQVENGH